VFVALRCLIIDDNKRFLEAARSRLDAEEVEVIGVATTGADVLAQIDKLRPDVVLVDINLGDENGFELIRELVVRHPWLQDRMVLISTRAEEDYADLIAASPARGFLSKSQLSAAALVALLAKPS
jgi:two-component system, NarL family, nitrate/nitrite response regulator NarL